MNQKQIVTGVAGFIGSTLARKLLDRGDRVIGIDCLTDYYPARIKRNNLEPLLQNPGFTFIEKKIADLDWTPILEGAATVFHQAAQAGVRKSWGREFQIYTDLNIVSTQAVLEALKGTGIRIVYASSSSVYGDTDQLPMREDQRCRPHSPYGVSKLAAENLCCLYWRNFEVPAISLRYFTVYGPRQRPDMAFHRFIRAGLEGKPITLFDDGNQTRDFTFVDDIVEANILAAEKGDPGAIYNIGGGSRISINDVLEKIRGILNRPLAIDRQEVQKGDVRHTYADTTRARRDLGFDPRFSLDRGLELEAQWIESSLPLLV